MVGQGNLSWALDSLLRGDTSSQPKLVTGRVTKNLLGMFSGGNKETLEVTLRFAAGAPKLWAAADSFDMQAALTPSGASEWNSFLQANPQIGDPSQMSRVASPAMSQGMPVSMNRRDSIGPSALTPADSTMGIQRVAPVPVDASQMPSLPTGGSSRPSSRTSNRPPRKRPPTGRPVGRPRKRPVEGNTSGYEDGTEGEDAPVKKRAKTTKVERASNPFVPGNESLRVTVSTSASLRNIRPVNNEGNNATADHLQEVPRAPTPVPKNASLPGQRGKMRRESTLGQKPLTMDSGLQRPLSPSQEDGRSPESNEPTPSYSVDSPGDIGSSPPMARATPYLRSSPPPSSPMLPPMPNGAVPREDSVMTENGDLFGDEQSLPPPRVESRAAFTQPAARIRKPKKPLSYPVSVFQMQDGPLGQDLVHICSYNSRPLNPPSSSRNKKQSPAPAPAAPVSTAPVPLAANIAQQMSANEQPSLPPLTSVPAAAKPKGSSVPSPPLQQPTPPPTTDAVDKATSPVDGVDVVPQPAAEPVKAADMMVPPPARPGSAGQADKPASQPPKLAAKPRRPLGRSQSSGPLALPAVPASEPIGPSSLSRASMPEVAQPVAPSRRGSTHGALTLPIPASDPAGPPCLAPQADDTSFLEAPCPPSEAAAPPPPSSPGNKPKKNMVKKDAIRNRLEQAILNGEMPPFCNNCGAIETPTWRKIWTQEHPGVPPENVQLSGEPGRITSLDVLERDEKEVPTRFRITKKSLGPDEDKHEWRELLLCNPCGIWLAKWNAHRPRDRWDRDASRLGQDRKPRGSGRQRSRAKRAPRKIEPAVNPTSEAYLHTDAVGPVEPSSPKAADASQPANIADPVSTHSRASGTAKSPINVELDTAMGVTKRLLFPSPRKEGVLKTLGDVKVNLVHTPADLITEKVAASGKENLVGLKESLSHDELEALFRSPGPAARPSTPPPNGKSELPGSNFKTPTQPTPNHRPITRSVSRSIRSVRSILASPGNLAMLQRTPTKTPRAIALAVPDSASRRRSPRNHQAAFDIFDTPITRTINQMLSEPNGFGLDGNDIDLGNLPSLDSHNDLIDFGALLSTDAIMPSSPPKAGSIAFDYDDSEVWANWGVDGLNGMDHE